MLRIAAATARPVTLRFADPLRTAAGEFHERTSVILALQDSDGVTGYGEAAPWPGFGTETAERALEVLRDAARRITGASIADDEPLADLAGLPFDAPAARAAVGAAAWDLVARRAPEPLAARLASALGPFRGRPLGRVSASVLLREEDPDALRQAARRARDAGYGAAKIKLGAAVLEIDVARARAAREGLGPEAALRGDANGAWDEATARVALRALAPFALAYVEQPLPAADVAGLARLRRDSPLRIAADESVASADGARRLIEAGAADVLVLKPAMLGGPAQALGTATHARQAGCDVVFTHALESAIGARHALHCAAAWGDPAIAHGLATAGLFVNDVATAPGASKGTIALGDAAGIGPIP